MTAKYASGQSLIDHRYQAAKKIQSQFRGHSVRKSEAGVQVASVRRPFQEGKCPVCHEKYAENPGLKRRVTKCFHQCCEDCVIKMSRAGSLKKCHLCQQENPFTEKEIKLIDPGKGIARLAQRDQDARFVKRWTRSNILLRVAAFVVVATVISGVVYTVFEDLRGQVLPLGHLLTKDMNTLEWLNGCLEVAGKNLERVQGLELFCAVAVIGWLAATWVGFNMQCKDLDMNAPRPVRESLQLQINSYEALLLGAIIRGFHSALGSPPNTDLFLFSLGLPLMLDPTLKAAGANLAYKLQERTLDALEEEE